MKKKKIKTKRISRSIHTAIKARKPKRWVQMNLYARLLRRDKKKIQINGKTIFYTVRNLNELSRKYYAHLSSKRQKRKYTFNCFRFFSHERIHLHTTDNMRSTTRITRNTLYFLSRTI